MHRPTRSGDSHWALVADLLSARVLVWVASVGREADLTPDAHRYFFDRYSRLAEYHRVHRHPERAARLQAKADAHYRPGLRLDLRAAETARRMRPRWPCRALAGSSSMP